MDAGVHHLLAAVRVARPSDQHEPSPRMLVVNLCINGMHSAFIFECHWAASSI